jgi:hypothetical protein
MTSALMLGPTTRRNPFEKCLIVLLITMSIGCVRSVPLTAPKLPTVVEPVASSPSVPAEVAPLPTSIPGRTPTLGLAHSQEPRSGSDCQISLLGTFPLDEAPSINQALEDASLTLSNPALQFKEEYLFLGILSRNCIVVFTNESP